MYGIVIDGIDSSLPLGFTSRSLVWKFVGIFQVDCVEIATDEAMKVTAFPSAC